MPKPYPREFRDDVVAVARRREDGVSIKQIAADFGISETCLQNWLRAADVEDKGIEWVATGLATERMSAELLQELREEIVEAERQAEAGNYQPFFDSDARLHQEIVRATGNTRLIRARATVEPFVLWIRVLGATGPHRINGSTHRHLEIVDAMIRGDVAAAQAAAALHLDEVEEWTAADMESALQP